MAKTKPEAGLIKCKDCGADFDEDSTIVVCGECNEEFCEKCLQDDHNCKRDDYGEPTVDCSKCGDDCSSDARNCNECSQNFCPDCFELHTKKMVIDSSTEYDYKEYVDEKVKDAI